jgi:1-deoxy-D-xylulose-5-phosphate synthase
MDATVVDMRFVKPIDAALVSEIEKAHSHIVTVEDGVALGGAGSAVREIVSRPCMVLNLGLPDQFVEHGDTPSLYEQCGLSEKKILESIQKFIG